MTFPIKNFFINSLMFLTIFMSGYMVFSSELNTILHVLYSIYFIFTACLYLYVFCLSFMMCIASLNTFDIYKKYVEFTQKLYPSDTSVKFTKEELLYIKNYIEQMSFAVGHEYVSQITKRNFLKAMLQAMFLNQNNLFIKYHSIPNIYRGIKQRNYLNSKVDYILQLQDAE